MAIKHDDKALHFMLPDVVQTQIHHIIAYVPLYPHYMPLHLVA